MKQNNKIAVIGGTGKSGKYLVKELINKRFRIKLLLRNPEKLQINNSLIETLKGDARNYGDVLSLINGCDAVISTLGQPKGEPTIFSQATRNIIQAMNECNVKCYIVTTGLNVDTPLDKKSPKTKYGTDWMKTNYPETTFDKQEEFNILSGSNLHWTLIRLPMIELTDETKKLLISLEDCPGEKISATDLSRFLIEQLSDNTYIRKAPFIANE
jgi:putative NADH-flavin reductase